MRKAVPLLQNQQGRQGEEGQLGTFLSSQNQEVKTATIHDCGDKHRYDKWCFPDLWRKPQQSISKALREKKKIQPKQT